MWALSAKPSSTRRRISRRSSIEIRIPLTDPDPPSRILPATAVAIGQDGVLILGRSGAGKSSLALELISRGSRLIADDCTEITAEGSALWAGPLPGATRGLIEARGIGILRCPFIDQARLLLAIDLDQEETDRLPPRRTVDLLDRTLPVIHARNQTGLAAAIRLWLTHGRAH